MDTECRIQSVALSSWAGTSVRHAQDSVNLDVHLTRPLSRIEIALVREQMVPGWQQQVGRVPGQAGGTAGLIELQRVPQDEVRDILTDLASALAGLPDMVTEVERGNEAAHSGVWAALNDFMRTQK